MTVYIDIVFIVNVISSLLLLFCADLFFSAKGKWYRILMSSIVCGIYAVVNAIYNLLNPVRLIVLFFMILTAWGYKGILYNMLRVVFLEGVTVIAIIGISGIVGVRSFVFESGVTLIARDWVTAVITVTAYPLLIVINAIRKGYKRLVPATFYIDGKELKLRLLYDSGNLLCHKGIPVAVIDWRNFSYINSYEEILLAADERLIYNTVSSSGIMPVTKPERAIFSGIERECYIGLTDKHFIGYAGVIGDIN